MVFMIMSPTRCCSNVPEHFYWIMTRTLDTIILSYGIHTVTKGRMNDFLLKFDRLKTIRVTEGSFSSSVLVTAVRDVMLTRADAATSATLP